MEQASLYQLQKSAGKIFRQFNKLHIKLIIQNIWLLSYTHRHTKEDEFAGVQVIFPITVIKAMALKVGLRYTMADFPN